jgi:hypothetical protein
LIKCDGQGNFTITQLEDFDEKLRKLSKLRDEDIITKEQFEEYRKKILDKL